MCFTATARFIAVDVEHSAAPSTSAHSATCSNDSQARTVIEPMAGQEKGAWWWQ
ncbi:hypothetical protein I541_5263 [Mycobacteroides abscessus]|nr:hypothetical protein L836_5426 [Mycobacteroides abscessus MAB_110811_2726]EUA73054.1 hypothetical protein I541_5263 [Mycobacteroides abscessus]